VYLDSCLKASEKLKKGIKDLKVVCFADDILLICDNKQEAVDLIKEIDQLSRFNLNLNKNKSFILSNHKELKNIDELCDIKIKA
jgi:hypothetical protein